RHLEAPRPGKLQQRRLHGRRRRLGRRPEGPHREICAVNSSAKEGGHQFQRCANRCPPSLSLGSFGLGCCPPPAWPEGERPGTLAPGLTCPQGTTLWEEIDQAADGRRCRQRRWAARPTAPSPNSTSAEGSGVDCPPPPPPPGK